MLFIKFDKMRYFCSGEKKQNKELLLCSCKAAEVYRRLYRRFMYRSPLAFTPSRLKVVFPHSFKSTKSCTVTADNLKHCEHLPASHNQRHSVQPHFSIIRSTPRCKRRRLSIKSVSTSLELRPRSVAGLRNAATHEKFWGKILLSISWRENENKWN